MQTELSSRAVTALKFYKPVTGDKRKSANEKEQEVASALGGEWLPNHEPADALIPVGKRKIGLEIKTMFENEKGEIRIDDGAMKNKVNWVRQKMCDRFDMVVINHQTGEMWYRRGIGNFSINSMYKVKDYNELKKLIEAKPSSLPASAQYKEDTEYHRALTHGPSYARLLERAAAADAAKKARRDKSRAKAKEAIV
jgi:hypothetical protein